MAEGLVPTVLRTTIGSMAEFRLGDDWTTWEERLEQYFCANYVEEDKKVSVLLTLIGEQAYKTLRDICDPVKPKHKTYVELCTILRKQFTKRISVFKETIRQWYARLKSKASECKFGNILSSVLKDKFITGLKKGPILDRLCEEEHTLSFEALVEIALKKEATFEQVNCTTEIHAVGSVRRSQTAGANQNQRIRENNTMQNSKCQHCGKGNHVFSACRYKTYRCRLCSKTGHLAQVCPGKRSNYVSVEAIEEEQFQRKEEETIDYVEMYYMYLDTQEQNTTYLASLSVIKYLKNWSHFVNMYTKQVVYTTADVTHHSLAARSRFSSLHQN
ncbi:uncharacterized protein [Diabrotica undecimpunctata]|uniref:uncharacterized protein n=1 Tax=Diabrotica undecimpunctata TaxID=50387 RepID=UPI003B63A1E6